MKRYIKDTFRWRLNEQDLISSFTWDSDFGQTTVVFEINCQSQQKLPAATLWGSYQEMSSESFSFSLYFLLFPPLALSTTMGSLQHNTLHSNPSLLWICSTVSLASCRTCCLITVILIEINRGMHNWQWPGGAGQWWQFMYFLLHHSSVPARPSHSEEACFPADLKVPLRLFFSLWRRCLW